MIAKVCETWPALLLYIYELVCKIQKSAQCHIDRAKCVS